MPPDDDIPTEVGDDQSKPFLTGDKITLTLGLTYKVIDTTQYPPRIIEATYRGKDIPMTKGAFKPVHPHQPLLWLTEAECRDCVFLSDKAADFARLTEAVRQIRGLAEGLATELSNRTWNAR